MRLSVGQDTFKGEEMGVCSEVKWSLLWSSWGTMMLCGGAGVRSFGTHGGIAGLRVAGVEVEKSRYSYTAETERSHAF